MIFSRCLWSPTTTSWTVLICGAKPSSLIVSCSDSLSKYCVMSLHCAGLLAFANFKIGVLSGEVTVPRNALPLIWRTFGCLWHSLTSKLVFSVERISMEKWCLLTCFGSAIIIATVCGAIVERFWNLQTLCSSPLLRLSDIVSSCSCPRSLNLAPKHPRPPSDLSVFM